MSKAFAIEELDETDRELLRLLQADGTLSSAALGERLSMTVTPCWRRRKRLEELGIIKDYQANLDRRKLGYDVMAFAQVRFGNHSANAPDAERFLLSVSSAGMHRLESNMCQKYRVYAHAKGE